MTASLAPTIFLRELIFTGSPARCIGDHGRSVDRHTMQLPDCRQCRDDLLHTEKIRQQRLQDQGASAKTADCDRSGIARAHPSEINTGKNYWQTDDFPALNSTSCVLTQSLILIENMTPRCVQQG